MNDRQVLVNVGDGNGRQTNMVDRRAWANWQLLIVVRCVQTKRQAEAAGELSAMQAKAMLEEDLAGQAEAGMGTRKNCQLEVSLDGLGKAQGQAGREERTKAETPHARHKILNSAAAAIAALKLNFMTFAAGCFALKVPRRDGRMRCAHLAGSRRRDVGKISEHNKPQARGAGGAPGDAGDAAHDGGRLTGMSVSRNANCCGLALRWRRVHQTQLLPCLR